MFADNDVLGQQALFPSFINGTIIALIASIAGLAIRLTYVYFDIENIRESVEATNINGLKTTLGSLPPPKQHSRAKSYSLPSDLVPWFTEYKDKYPKYASIFEAVLLIYEATPLPASPVKGGHGGLSLKDHSFNVLREILRAKKNFSYVGSVNKSGAIRVGLTDKNYKFNQHDPAIPLLGFIHDLGKMNCYKLKNGEVIEVKKNHDVQGSRILTGLPEFIALTNDNQNLKNRLSVIMAYYHHPVEMPLWTDDHTRALTELLITADNAASKKEGGHKADYTSDITSSATENEMPSGYLEILAEGAAQTVDELHDEIGKARLEQLDAISDDNESGEEPAKVKPAEAKPAKYVKNPTSSQSKTPGFKETNVERKFLLLGESIFNTLKKEITKDSTLMDASNKNSIGFVKKDLYYFHDIAVRKYLQVVLGDSAFTRDKSGQQNKYSFALLAYLMSKEWLYCIHEGKNYSSKRAYFTIVKTIRGDRSVNEVAVKYYFIVNEEAFADVTVSQKFAPTKYGISIAGPSWGDGCDFKLPSDSNNIEIPVDDSDKEFLNNIKENGETASSIPAKAIEVGLDDTTTQDLADIDDNIEVVNVTTPSDNLDLLSFALDYQGDTSSEGHPSVTNVDIDVDDPTPSEVTADIDSDVPGNNPEEGGDYEEEDDEDDEDEYIEPNERIGILAVIAKLQYANNKKLKAVEKRLLNGNNYLYYPVVDVCLKFHYVESDLSKDIVTYRNEYGKAKIGVQKLDDGTMAVYIKESEVTP